MSQSVADAAPVAAPASRVPESISHDQFMSAMQPLLELLHLSSDEVFYPIVIDAGTESSFGRITLPVLIAKAQKPGTFPVPVSLPDDVERPAAYVEPTWMVTVKVR